MRIIKLLALLVAVPLIVNACVDNTYDFEKINTAEDASILKGVGFPIGSFEEFSLRDIVSMDNEAIKTDEGGNYYLYYKGKTVSKSFNMNAAAIDAFPPSLRTDYQSLLFPGISVFEDRILNFTDNYEYKVDNYYLPKEIKKLYKAVVSGALSLDLSYTADAAFPFSRIWIAKETKLSLPAWLIMGEISDSRFTRYDDNTLIVGEDIALAPNENTTISVPLAGMDFTKLPEGQGLTGSNTLFIDDWFKLGVNVKIKKEDALASPPGTYGINLKQRLGVSEISVVNVDAELDVQHAVENQVFSMGKLPAFLTDGTTALDFSDIRIYLDANSNLPFVLNFKTDFTTYSGDEKIALCKLGSEAAPVLIPNGKVSYVFTEKGLGKEGIKDYKVENLNSLFVKIPSKIELSNLTVSSGTLRTTINLNESFNLGLDYWIDTPLAFGKGISFIADQKLSGFELNDGDLKLKTVILKTDIVNTIPLAFDIAGEAIDAAGNVCAGIKVKVTGNIKQGSVENPSSSPLVMEIASTGSSIVMDGVRLNLKASSPEETFRNVCLNSKQGIKFTGVRLELPDGLVISTKK